MKWYFGIMSRSIPLEIMLEIYKMSSVLGGFGVSSAVCGLEGGGAIPGSGQTTSASSLAPPGSRLLPSFLVSAFLPVQEPNTNFSHSHSTCTATSLSPTSASISHHTLSPSPSATVWDANTGVHGTNGIIGAGVVNSSSTNGTSTDSITGDTLGSPITMSPFDTSTTPTLTSICQFSTSASTMRTG
ncbi:hypothetical protein D9758_017132 [Tetrapyrgos nigripes]|uniref:Uncharacterized protein n=1 Tax=Tetrapyrgos nigripes TaxID=182062 RepID=A0A8H5F4S8_9AGAR|nr:hypothetical protein D9758_017132 [Tetrapyrgos nigripes]